MFAQGGAGRGEGGFDGAWAAAHHRGHLQFRQVEEVREGDGKLVAFRQQLDRQLKVATVGAAGAVIDLGGVGLDLGQR